jgi:hypothetical protein
MTAVQGPFEAFSPLQRAFQSKNDLQFSFPGGGEGTVCLALLDYSQILVHVMKDVKYQTSLI